ncbi:MAG: hypothetical protein LBI13_05305, partial [Streptococcaceae bacterium]|nr:hypothetical protein [Streptococcaceae bacterium]
TYKKHEENERLFLRFGAANYRAVVFFNQHYLGIHLGGSTPFSVEVTDYLKNENRLLIVTNNTRRAENLPMENTDWFNYGGIYRNVDLLRLPQSFIRDLKVGLEPKKNFNEIFATVKIDGISEGVAKFEIPELQIFEEIKIQNGVGKINVAARPELWSPEKPKLYEVILEFENDKVIDKIGFREIRVETQDVYLNNQKIFFKGIACHEDSVMNGKSLTDDEIRENYQLAKEMGCNYLRLAHYPHSERAAQIADEMGILLWEEIPVYWAVQFDNPETYMDAENQLTELINRDFNRASVVIWSVGNENADTNARYKFMANLADKAHELDCTRLVSAACLVNTVDLIMNDRLAEKLDVIGMNEYYGWYEPDFSRLIKVFENSKPEKPVFITEFGADATSENHGTRDEMFTEENQLAIYEKQIETLSKIKYIKGISPWILHDFRCPRRLHTKQNYYNLKGLVSADRKHKKLAFYAMRKFYQNLQEEL